MSTAHGGADHASLLTGCCDMVTPYLSSERLVEPMRLLPKQRRQRSIRHLGGAHMLHRRDESRRAFRCWARDADDGAPSA